MALNAAVLELIVKHCRRSRAAPGTALVAGYPDLLVTAADLLRLGIIDADPPEADGTIRIAASHGWVGQVFDSAWLFDRLGYAMSVVDVQQHRGCEIVADLNYPQDFGLFDLVLDHGTSEHCFNIAEAAVNLARSVRMGGFMVQHLPLNMFGHGFYDLNPEWFSGFYAHMGFAVTFLRAWHQHHGYLEMPLDGRFAGIPDNCLLSMVAIKRAEAKPGFPTQGIYGG